MPGRPWTQTELALLRTMSARETARRTGRTIGAIYNHPNRLGIHPDKRHWTAVEDRLLMTLPNKQAAARLHRSVKSVEGRRQRLGLTIKAK